MNGTDCERLWNRKPVEHASALHVDFECAALMLM